MMKHCSLLFFFLSWLLGMAGTSPAAQRPETVWKDYFGNESPVRVAAFSPDGKYLAAGGKNEIRLYRAQDGKLVRTMKYPINEANQVFQLKFSPDGKMLGVFKKPGDFRFWRVSDDRYLQNTEFNVGGDFAFSPDSQLLAFTTKFKKHVRVHRISGGAFVKTFPTADMTGAPVAFSPDGRLLAVRDNPGVVRIWRFSDGKLLRTLPWPKESGPGEIAFTPDGKFLATSILTNGNRDKRFYLWRVADGKKLHTLRTNWEIIHSAFDLSSDGKILVTGTGGPFPERRGQLHLWRVRDGKLLRTLGLARPTNSVSLSPDGRLLAYAQNDALIVAGNPVGNTRSANIRR